MPFVYVIKCNEFYKIGIATDVESRFSELQTGNPYEMSVASYFEFNRPAPIEGSLHQRFDSKRERGEWFRLDSTDLDLIDNICAMLGGVKHTEVVVADKTSDDDEEIDVEALDDTSSLGINVRAMVGYSLEKRDGLFVVTEIARALGMGISRVSRIARKLENAGLLSCVQKDSNGHNLGRHISPKLAAMMPIPESK